MNTTENNKLIAEFMGETKQPFGFPQFGYIKTNGDWKDTFFDSELKFHKDWNWLMEVVEKCRDTDHYQAYTHYKPIMDMIGTLDILNVYQAVVEFIKWHNEKQ
jgi:hypothetical protein